MDDQIEKYIRANQDRFTRQSITEKLLSAGHDPAAIDAAWARVDAGTRTAAPVAGWRPRWPLLLTLVILGAIGAAPVWAGDPYGGGIAPVVYVILVGIGIGLASALSALIDGGRATTAGVLLALVAVGGAVLSITSGVSLVALGIAVVAGLPALVLLTQRGDRRASGWVAAAIPLAVWVVVTGTCYAPLWGRILNP